MAIGDSLVRYFSLDEASGNAIDAVGGLNLTETGGTIASVAGKVGNARDNEHGDGTYFRTTSESDLRGGNTDFTWAGWINAESFTGFDPVLGKWGTTDHEYLMWVGGGNTLNWTCAEADGTEVTNSWEAFTLATGTWYFIVVWHDSVNDQIGISVNDGTPDTVAFPTGVDSTTQEFSLAGNEEAGNKFDGLVDEWGFWRRKLSASDITFLYNSGNGRSYAEIASKRFLLTRF